MYSIRKICEKRKSKLMIGSHARSSYAIYSCVACQSIREKKKQEFHENKQYI